MTGRVREHQELRELPAYTYPEVAWYSHVSQQTLCSWVRGYHYPTLGGRRTSRGLTSPPEGGGLSFMNLVEAHMLASLRREHGISMQRIRKALENVRQEIDPSLKYPLASGRILTDGLDLFMEHAGRLWSLTEGRQQAMREIVKAYARRIEWNREGLPDRLYPFMLDRRTAVSKQAETIADQKLILIDHRIRFGKPVIAGTRVAAEVVADRFFAGDTFEILAADYQITVEQIEAALRCRRDAA